MIYTEFDACFVAHPLHSNNA